MRTKSNLLATMLFVLVLVGISIGSRAQDYPTRPVTIIVPTAAGGALTSRATDRGRTQKSGTVRG